MAIQIKEEKRKLPTAVNINIKPELPKQVKVSIHSTPPPPKKQVKISVIPTTVVTVMQPKPVGIPIVVDMSKQIKCNICDKTFSKVSSLEIHQRMHNGK